MVAGQTQLLARDRRHDDRDVDDDGWFDCGLGGAAPLVHIGKGDQRMPHD